MENTAGQLLVQEHLPDDMKHYANKALDKKGIGDLFTALTKRPEIYNDVASNMARLGFELATVQGSSVSLDDLKSPIDKDKRFRDVEKEVEEIKKKKLSKLEERNQILDKYQSAVATLDKDVLEAGIEKGISLAKTIRAGSRGSSGQYRATVAAPGLVVDADENPILEVPVKHSFAEGLSLPEYLVSTFSARNADISKKLSVADSGFTAKQLSRATMPEQVEEHDCGTNNGIPVSVKDKDSIGCFLAHPVKDYKKNTEIKPEVLADLENNKIEEIIIRSPVTCESSAHYHPGAVCQLCVGIRENGLPELKSFVGVIAAGCLSEPLTQATLNKKHQNQVIGASKQLNQGFELINQLLNIPKNFPGEAALATIDGKITDIKSVSTGGTNIYINEKEHYVSPGLTPTVKKGDEVEQGDLMSEGIINPAKIVEYKGIGEGRLDYVKNLHEAFINSGIPVNRRNFELLGKVAIDHVKITDPEGIGEYLPDQIVSYQNLVKNYVPPKNAISTRIDKAYGKYIQEPVLHYTIGTRVTKPVQKYLNQHKIESILVTDHPPGFHPVMQRILDIPAHQDDFFGQMYSTYLQDRLENSVNTGIGSSSDIAGPHPIVGIAYGLGFGNTLKPAPKK